jgi:hypothetical protein
MSDHEHKRPRTCRCSIQGLEPNEDCPIHGFGEWPPRCEACGKFMPWRSEQAMEAPAPESAVHGSLNQADSPTRAKSLSDVSLRGGTQDQRTTA